MQPSEHNLTKDEGFGSGLFINRTSNCGLIRVLYMY